MSSSVSFDTNPALELWLKDLNSLLAGVEIKAVSQYDNKPAFPMCFIVGSPGSGSTLLLQWLAATNAFTYPSNLISRFYMAPYIGAKIQKMLIDPELSFKNEMVLPEYADRDFFESDLGKTYGLFAPNDFLRFWQRFFDYEALQKMSRHELNEIDMNVFGSELAGFESVNNKPIAMKALFMNWNLPFLAEFFPKAIFIYLKREVYYNVQSVFLAQKKISSDASQWFSFKPPEYTKLINMNCYKQAAGQVHFTNKAIQKGLQNIKENQKITIDYEKFCKNPIKVWDEINNRFNTFGFTFHRNYNGLDYFYPANTVKVSKKEKDRIVAAYYSLFGENIGPK